MAQSSIIIPFYASFFAFYYVLLSVRVIKNRIKNKISLGDGVLEFLSFVDQERSKEQPDETKAQKHPYARRTIDYSTYRHVQRVVRAHANFAEYVPFTLLLLFFIEVNNYLSSFWLHVVCSIFLFARIAHADIAFNNDDDKLALSMWRRVGAVLTFFVIIFAGFINGYNFLFQ
ncbi:7238_t:CDS:2 [Diversispora eburnea]|uniref:7238_t:CDS:1 n=1 Tax=Diversispora eburnea TaxID=1213867 RepID=A0A9N8WKF6_9GLOM|nr:7238_t:CDS:2 [Diversispora eburnea]